ncbi:hypothetical protein L1049_013976 [Liquidambar formosana]|uniref:ATP-dependent RNA helicase n=1 Tax=Liquidambar formosana TaxID=63359 RepID=A0AAP0RML9_LIQFO
MLIKLPPPLRLFNPSLPLTRFPTMKFGSSVQSSRPIPIFSRVFPFKVKYLGLRFPVSRTEQLGLRRFSTRPFRPRNSEFSRGKERGEVRTSRSLIEDEDELSNWVGKLRPDSFRGRLTSEDDDSDVDRGPSRGSRSRYGDRGGGGRGREGVSSLKRRRESDSDEFGESNRGSPRNSFSRNSRGGMSNSVGKRQFESKWENADGELHSQRNRGGGGGSRGGLSSMMNKRGGRDSNSGYGRDRGDSRGGFSSVMNKRGGRDSNSGYGRDRGDSRGGFSSMMNKRGGRDSDLGYGRDRVSSRGGPSSTMNKRGGRDFEMGNWRDRGDQGSKMRGPLMSDEKDSTDDDDEEEEEEEEEEGENLKNSFKGFLSEEDSEEGDEDDDGDGDDDAVFKKNAASVLGLDKEVIPNVLPRTSPGNESYLSETMFDQCSVSPLSLKGIKDAGYEKMTMVQEATLPVILKGKDVLAKAKTGTGKTVAFLLPSIEVVVKSPPVGRDQKRPPILVLVICPTRELASQAAAEANTLLKYHPTIGVQVVIGGTRLTLEQKRMQANPCQILVATPGRLKDHIENTAGFATRLMGVKVLILDEADHLLDMGFRKDIEKIIAAVPKQRQTLLFSATVPEEVRQICHIALKRDHEFINTVQEGSEETHAQVRQMHLVGPLDKHFSLLYVILKEHISDDVDYKVLVFCTTAMVTKLVANLLGELNLNVREIHSRKPQSYRTRISDEFRKSKGLILVTSDVSARGVDYPDVTLVIQVGLPADREQYIHRLGRTGRKGKEGQGILLLAPWEEFFLSSIKDLPLTKAPVPSVDPDTRKKVERALSQVEMKNKESAYQAWLGYYNSNKNVGRDKTRLVELANEFSRSMGLDNPPAIPRLILGKMGLKNVPGLRSK